MSAESTREELEKAAEAAAKYATKVFAEGEANSSRANTMPTKDQVAQAVEALNAASGVYRALYKS